MIDELRARQNPDGSFRYWAGGVESHDFVSVYALHVLLEASERGEPVPQDLLQGSHDFLLRMARRDGNNLEQERTSAYALYLLARQGTVVANEAAALQRRLQERYAEQWQTDIAAAYLAAAYQLMQQQALADRAIAAVAFGKSVPSDRWHGAMSSDGALLYLLAKHFPERLRASAGRHARRPGQAHAQAQNYNSLGAATTILALDAYATASGGTGGAEARHRSHAVRPESPAARPAARAVPEGRLPRDHAVAGIQQRRRPARLLPGQRIRVRPHAADARP